MDLMSINPFNYKGLLMYFKKLVEKGLISEESIVREIHIQDYMLYLADNHLTAHAYKIEVSTDYMLQLFVVDDRYGSDNLEIYAHKFSCWSFSDEQIDWLAGIILSIITSVIMKSNNRSKNELKSRLGALTAMFGINIKELT